MVRHLMHSVKNSLDSHQILSGMIQSMEFVIIAAALLAVNTLWFIAARRRNRHARMNAGLKRYINNEKDSWTEPRR